MWVPAPYKQTKNQTNATTDITAGSCYREVRWNWKVSTNGQNPTFSHLSARSQLRKWQCPSSSRCVAGHRQGHPEKDPLQVWGFLPVISLKNSPTAAESWIITYLQVWGFLPVNLHFATKLFTAVPNFLGHWMWVPAPYKQTKNQTYATTDITAGSCYREVRWNWKVSTNGQNHWIFDHFLSARSQLRKWQWPSSSRCVAGHRQGHQEKDPHFSKELAHGCWKLNNTLSPSLGLFTRESSLCD